MLGEWRDVLVINVAKLSDSLRDCTHKTKPAWGRPELSWSKQLSITDECPQWLPVNNKKKSVKTMLIAQFNYLKMNLNI